MPALKIEPPDKIEPDIAPQTTELAGEQPTATEKPADAKPDSSKKKMDTAGVEQFLKAQIGDRYKDLAKKPEEAPEPEKKAKEEPEEEEKGKTPPRGEDGKFQKAKEEKPKAPKPQPAKTAFKPKPQPQATPLTAEQIASAAAEGATRALTAKPRADEGESGEKKPKGPDLPPDEMRRVEILNRMEVLNPEKYKGLAEKYTKSLTALETYAKTWEKEHPGQEFDEESPEHESFFKENDVEWNDLDFTEALADIISDRKLEKSASKLDERMDELDRKEKLREQQGKIVAEQNAAAVEYWQQLGDDVADMVKPDGTLNMEKVDSLKTNDPEGLSIRVTAAQALDVEVAEIYKLYAGLAKNDPANNVIHRNINQFAASKEQELAGKPMQEKLNGEGQSFLPASQYYKLPVAERENHWTFNASDLAFMRAADLAAITKKRIELNEERHRAWAKARGIQLEDTNAKPASPSAGGESRMAALETPAAKSGNPVHNQFLKEQIGR